VDLNIYNKNKYSIWEKPTILDEKYILELFKTESISNIRNFTDYRFSSDDITSIIRNRILDLEKHENL
jgi:hypothetical protein